MISRRQFNDRRKTVSSLCEQIRSRIANHIDDGEDYFCIDSKPIEVCGVLRENRCKMGKDGDFTLAPNFAIVPHKSFISLVISCMHSID